jgi:hypothetical protein
LEEVFFPNNQQPPHARLAALRRGRSAATASFPLATSVVRTLRFGASQRCRKRLPVNAKTKWSIEADYIQACSCDYGCPCEFSAPPTKGFCEGLGAWRINRGQYGDLSLDGLGLGFVARWPKAIHEGNGTLCVFVDERASAKQREALLEIASGKAGGLPFEIISMTITKVLDPQFVPFKFNINGRNSTFQVGNAIEVNLEAIKNPVTGEPESVRVQHDTGFIFKEAECTSTAKMRGDAGELKFSWPNKAAFVAQVKYNN